MQNSGYVIPMGFKFYGNNVGIKKKNYDFGVVFSETLCDATAVFTKNSFCGVSIPIGKQNIKDGKLQAVVVTSGVANVATGSEGTSNTLKIIKKLGNELNINWKNILPSSTGVIGVQLPIDKILNGINGIYNKLEKSNMLDFANAIRTTDNFIKVRSKKIGECSIMAIAKGSGMIEPNMATMLVYILTDAKLNDCNIYEMLKTSVDKSFNMISIDTDTSTSDTVCFLSNGMAGAVDVNKFQETLDELCIEVAKDIVIDGEGATKLIQVDVIKADSFEQSKKIGKLIINSPLVKTAIYGADPNWGRIAMAIGKSMEKDIIPDKIEISFGEYKIYDKGIIHNHLVENIKDYLKNNSTIEITVALNIGNSKSRVWGCDLTEKYVEINGLYTT